METEQELTPQEYQHLLAQYESSFKNLQEGQIIRGRVLSITPSEVIVDIGYKSEGMIPLSEFTDFSGQVTIKAGRSGRRPPRAHRGSERLRRPLQGQGREDEGLGRGREVLSLGLDRPGPRHRPHQGRPRRGHRRQGVPAGLARGRQAGQEPRGAARQGPRLQGHLRRQEARQHRPLAQGRRRGRAGGPQEGDAAAPRGGTRPARHRQEPHRLRRLRGSRRPRRPAPRHRHVVGPRQPSLGPRQGRRRDRGRGPQVRPGDRARLARHQAADRGSVGPRAREVPRRLARHRPRHQRDRLRRLRRARGRRRGPGPRLRDVLVEEDQESRQGGLARRHGRGRRLRRQPRGAPHLALAEGHAAGSVGERRARSTRSAAACPARFAT